MEDEDEIKHSIEQSSMAELNEIEERKECGDVEAKSTAEIVEDLRLVEVRGGGERRDGAEKVEDSTVEEKSTVENVEDLRLEELRGGDEERRDGVASVEELKVEEKSMVEIVEDSKVEELRGGEERRDGAASVEESKLEEKTTVENVEDLRLEELSGGEGRRDGVASVEESKVEDLKLEELRDVEESGSEERRNEAASVVETKVEEVVAVEVGGEERVRVGDDVVEMEEVEERRNEGENVGEESKLEEKATVLEMEGVIEELEEKEVEEGKVDNDDGEERSEKVNDKEELVGEEEEMEDSEATVDEEASPRSRVVEEEVETPIADTEMETETEVVKSGSGGKRKRGRAPKASTPVKAASKKTVGEDVCFVCLDGGNLVLCDRRGCPKAYHPVCVDHDEEFFKTKGRWNCGWHQCNDCGKNAHFFCCTCTFSSCKGCSKDAALFCVKGSKGFCETCMNTVMMIESSEPDATGNAAFNDKNGWEQLFRDYWTEQKGKLSISSDELAQAKNLLRNTGVTDGQQTQAELLEATNDAVTDSDNSLANIDVTDSKRKRPKRKSKRADSDTDGSSEKIGPARRKGNRRSKSQAKEASSDSENSSENHGTTSSKRGKKAKRLSKSQSKAGDTEWASKELMEFVMHMKNGDRSVLAPFDVQSLLLEYISRNKLRDPRRQSQILCDSMLQKLFGKPRVGHFEMLKLLESHFLLKEDSHALNSQGSVLDAETSQLDAEDHTDLFTDSGKSRGRKSRKRDEDRGQSNLDDYAAIDMHNINLIYLRRCLMESLMDDSEMFHNKVVGSFVRIRISGSNQKQDIYRLVQIIGTSKAPEPYKVGKRTTDVMLEILNLDKTEIIAIDTISNQDFTEDECKRLRQSIKCGLISRMTVGDVLDKARELQGVRVTDWLEAEILRLGHLRDRASEKGRKKELRECVEKLQLLKTPEERQRRLEQIPEVHADPKMDPSCESDDENDLHDTRQVNDTRLRESGSVRRGRDHFSSRHGGSVSNESWSGNARPPKTWELARNSSSKGFSSRRDDNNSPSRTSEHAWGNGVDKGTPRSNSWEKPRVVQDTVVSTRAEQSGTRSDLSVAVPSESSMSLSSPAGQNDGKVNDTEKAWHYRDPTGKVQGPFSMSQLRKWSNTGYFPAELKIWKTSQTEDHSILLTEALAGRFQEFRSVGTTSGRYDSSSLPSPTPSRSPAALSGKQISGSLQSTNKFQGNERLPSPTPTSPSNLSDQLKGNVGNKHENLIPSTGTSQPGSGQFVSNSVPINLQQMSSQTVARVTNQPSIPPNAAMNQTNVGSSGSGNVQGFSNTGQNPSVYTQNWGAGYVARPEMVNANLTLNNALPVQVAYNQWTGAPVSNQGPPYAAGAGYPSAQGNIAANFPNMQVNTAWRPPAQTNMPWGAQQQPVNQNVGWAGPPSGAMGQPSPGAMGQPSPGAQPMAAGPSNGGWTGTTPSPAAGNTNMVWVAAPGTTSARGGDQNRNGGGGQWNRQSSFGSGGQRVCKYFREHGNCRKGSSCDFMHT